MLDQNTDRSWWMIGSVVVGALLLGLAQVFFPDVVKEIQTKFTEMITNYSFTPKTGMINPMSLFIK